MALLLSSAEPLQWECVWSLGWREPGNCEPHSSSDCWEESQRVCAVVLWSSTVLYNKLLWDFHQHRHNYMQTIWEVKTPTTFLCFCVRALKCFEIVWFYCFLYKCFPARFSFHWTALKDRLVGKTSKLQCRVTSLYKRTKNRVHQVVEERLLLQSVYIMLREVSENMTFLLHPVFQTLTPPSPTTTACLHPKVMS